MREIKFRVWDKEEKVMMYQRDEWFVDDEYDLLTFPLETKNIILCGGSESFIPLQYTGLKDRQGKEIYEGDILLVEGYKNMQVRWNDECACFGIAFKKGATSSIPENVEIIGSVYETPELLSTSK